MRLIHRARLSSKLKGYLSRGLTARLPLVSPCARARADANIRIHVLTYRVAIVSDQHVRTTSFSINEFSVETRLFLRSDVALGSLSFSGGFFSLAVLSAAKLSLSGNRGGDGGTIFKVRRGGGSDFIIPYSHRIISGLYNFSREREKKTVTYAPRPLLRYEQPAVAVICSFYEKFYICPSCSLTRSR